MLNLILQDYAQTLDLDTIRLTTTLAIGPQATIPYFYALPANYLRMYDIFYNVDGTVYTPKQFELSELDAAYTAEGVDNYPTRYATDVSQSPPQGAAPLIAFYPPPAVPIVVTMRYRPSSLDIVTPEVSAAIPYFPNQMILLKELCIQVGDVAGGDDRSDRWAKEVENRMRKYLIMDDDKEGYSQTVQLDSRFFRRNTNLPPSKILGF